MEIGVVKRVRLGSIRQMKERDEQLTGEVDPAWQRGLFPDD